MTTIFDIHNPSRRVNDWGKITYIVRSFRKIEGEKYRQTHRTNFLSLFVFNAETVDYTRIACQYFPG
jgi:hypothetical protein